MERGGKCELEADGGDRDRLYRIGRMIGELTELLDEVVVPQGQGLDGFFDAQP